MLKKNWNEINVLFNENTYKSNKQVPTTKNGTLISRIMLWQTHGWSALIIHDMFTYLCPYLYVYICFVCIQVFLYILYMHSWIDMFAAVHMWHVHVYVDEHRHHILCGMCLHVYIYMNGCGYVYVCVPVFSVSYHCCQIAKQVF